MKGSPKGDFFRYRAKYGLTDALLQAGRTGPAQETHGRVYGGEKK